MTRNTSHADEVYFPELDSIWQEGNFEAAEERARGLLENNPSNASAKIILGRALTTRSQFDEAENAFREAAEDSLLNAEATLGLFENFLFSGRYALARAEALQLVEQCKEAKFLSAYFRLPSEAQTIAGTEILRKKLFSLLLQNPKSAEIHLLLSRFYLLDGVTDHDKAANSYLHAVGCPDGGEKLLYDYAIFLYELGKFSQSARVFKELVVLQPQEAKHHVALAGIYFQLGSQDEAIEELLAAVEIDPDDILARCNLASTMSQKRRYDEAIKHIEIAMEGKSLAEIKSQGFWLKQALQKIYFKRYLADWSENPKDLLHVLEGASHEQLCSLQLPPFHVMTLQDSPEVLLRVAQAYCLSPHKVTELPKHSPVVDRKLRIGWFGADFHDHATMYLLMGVFREFDCENFEFSVYSYGIPRREKYRFGTMAEVDNFYDLAGQDDQEIITFAKSHELDIAIDLKGYTGSGRAGIFAARLAPIQISYLGYPGTTGKDYFDYLIADNTIVTPELRDNYIESIMYLPHSYQPNDPQRSFVKATVTRADYGLPEDSIVFCSFNQIYKLSPSEFEIWLNLLQSVDNSVLWLLTGGQADDVIRKKLYDHGIDDSRLVFGKGLKIDEHLSRLGLADIFLDSFVVNGHTSVSDALFAGLPVVTLPGSQFAARVGASLVKAAGCNDLVAKDQQDYFDIAFRLATDPTYRGSVKEHLKQNLIGSPLYDVKAYTRSLENLFSQAVTLSINGKAPRDIEVEIGHEEN